jgi:hypothetical protein
MTEPPKQPELPGPSDKTTELPLSGGPAPRKSRARMITALVVAAVLVLGGAGVGIYLATRDEDPANTSAANPTTTSSRSPDQTSPSESGGVSVPPGATPTGTPPDQSGQPEQPSEQPGSVDPAVLETAQRYAKAVSDKDENTAKSLSCDNQQAGILFDESVKVEVIGKTQMLDANSATVDVKVTIGQADPLEGFPLLLNREPPKGWCVT